MRVDVLDGATLDYWCARALCADGDTLRFTAVVPGVVVTAASDGLRRLDAHFAPTSSWADAGSVLERVDDVRIVRYGAGAACVARFTGIAGHLPHTPRTRARRCCARSCGRASANTSTRRRTFRMRSSAARSSAMRRACRFPKAVPHRPPATARTSVPCRACNNGAPCIADFHR